MRNIKLVLEYDGSTFFGFQRQPGKPTIQEVLEKALSGFFDRKMKIAAASGRTDAGVHAEGQVVNFKTSSAHQLWQIQKGLNALLPPPVVVKEIQEVAPNFHARYSVRSKVYEYRVWNHPCRSPLIAGRAFHVPYHLNITRMRRAAKAFPGKHDFRSFTSVSAMKKGSSCVRTIKCFQIKRQGHLILMHVEADGFLYHMIRNIVGTLLEVGRGKRKTEDIAAILKAKDRRLAGITAPSEGLTLIRVAY
ncbi:MAG: tRNA pseudouridine(38-40) synthase TruA [Omnitrophica bacterium RIFOXYB12_FULL_50_7]|nr:MAG: tRNA pseudouridine(38-40) synthase TruA [Omnitrophica bacterium RIFOXYB12_FULL_50_7]